jgi:hypothetical protein
MRAMFLAGTHRSPRAVAFRIDDLRIDDFRSIGPSMIDDVASWLASSNGRIG